MRHLFRFWSDVLGTHSGHITLLILLVLCGMAGDRCGLPLGEHMALAGLAVVLVELSKPGVAPHGTRIVALLILLVLGAIGTLLRIRFAEQMLLSTLAVLFVIIRDEPPTRPRRRRTQRVVL